MKRGSSRRPAVIRTKPEVIIRGVIIGYILTIIMLLTLAFLLYKFEISQSKIHIGIIITYILATLIAGLVTGKNIRERSWLWGVVTGFSYFIILVLISLVVNKGVNNVREMMTTLLMCCGGGMLGGMIS